MKKAIVVIPLYKTRLSDNEWLSLQRSLTVLASHPFAFVCPEGLDLSPLKATLQSVEHIVKRFDDSYFKGLFGYNQLMLSERFYRSFEEYEYMLICQTDVFVFDDRLDYWCDQGYDYIGAPWLASTQTPFHRLLFKINNAFRKNTSKKSNAHYFRVGNGGFSLRNTKAMLHAVARRQQHLASTSSLMHAHPKHLHIEDLYFSLVAPTLVDMKIPDYREAAGFCLDRRPKLGLKLNRGNLPFACHRFFDPKAIKLWKPFIHTYR